MPTVLAILIVLVAGGTARAQPPTGAVSGTVTDQTGAALSGVQVTLTHAGTGQVRTAVTSPEGHYTAPILLPGEYLLRAEAPGFKQLERTAKVEAGTVTTVDFALAIGDMSELTTVPGVQPLVRYEDHQVGGLVTREQIDALPLNGRDFLELAKLEPGVTNPTRLSDGRLFLSPLGGGLQTIPRIGNTRVSVDGGNVSTPGSVGVLLQLSQDAVQEFQMATVNFDTATGLTSSGAVNIVTRSGGHDYRGRGFYFYRDNQLAAYPGLRRVASDPDPFFRRVQAGGYAGGRLPLAQAFFFASYERHDQRGVVSVQPNTPAFAPLGGVFPSPYAGNQASARVDARLHPSHTAFVRYTHASNESSAGGASTLPSGWPWRSNEANQGMAAVTSVLSPNLVNDLRVSYYGTFGLQRVATTAECPGCFGVEAPRIIIADAGLVFGSPQRASARGRRLQLTETLVWQRGAHSVRLGFDWEHATSRVSNFFADPAQITVWSPGRVRALDPTIPLPESFTTLEAILRLPLRSFETEVGPGSPPWRDFNPYRALDLYRVFVGDRWRAGRRVTVDAGVGWSYEPNALNHDLPKPALLAPILGTDGLRAPAPRRDYFSPVLGVIWTATADGRTVVRAGAGRYFDPVASVHPVNLTGERHLLSPLGTGRFVQTGANFFHDGRPLEFPQPTTFTAADLLQILPGLRAGLLASLDPANRSLAVRNIDRTKEGENLYDPAYTAPSAVHLSVGIQRELPRGLVVSADVVWKHFAHTFINGIDYNRWHSASGPVIPACVGAQQHDLGAVCSNGPMYFDTTIGRARYAGLLARLEKRFSGRYQLLASYALGSLVGSNGTGLGTSENPGGRVFGFNNDDWFENYGPVPSDLRHVLDVSAFVELPWRLQVALNVSATSAPPFAPYVAGVDFNGDGTRDDLLPGTRVNQFGRGLDTDDLIRLVAAYNGQVAGRQTPGGQIAPAIALPPAFAFNDGFFTADVRVSRTLPLARGRLHVTLIAEMFNVFNVANLVGYGSNLAAGSAFGQPSARFTQIFGSGGPRASQLGVRVGF